MNILEFVLLRVARQRMTDEELSAARRLAAKGDAGDLAARAQLRLQCWAIAGEREEDQDGATTRGL
jgi:hypothetical protein